MRELVPESESWPVQFSILRKKLLERAKVGVLVCYPKVLIQIFKYYCVLRGICSG